MLPSIHQLVYLEASMRNGRIYCALTVLLLCGVAHAATLNVTSPADSGPGTLRDQIAAAASGDTILFMVPNTTCTLITFTGKSLTIDGNTTGATITALGSTALFSATGAPLTLTRLSVQQFTGVPVLSNSLLTVSACTFSQCSGSGPVVRSTTNLVCSNSTFANNTAGLVISNVSASTITNCTFSGNVGIAIDVSSGMPTNLVHCTISGNGTGLRLTPGGAAATDNCIIANNSADLNTALGTALIKYGGRNVIGNVNGAGLTATTFFPVGSPNGNGDFVGTSAIAIFDPLLGSLANHGGLTQTIPLLPTSAALHNAAASSETVDQRNVARPQGAARDIGAFENAMTTTTLIVALNPILVGQTTTITATVSTSVANAGTPTGSVQFTLDGFNFGSPLTLVSGIATFTGASFANAGTRLVGAVYIPTNSLTSTSFNFTQTVNKTNTTTALVTLVNPSPRNQPATFTATMTPVAPGGGVPGGTVQFVIDGVNSGGPVTVVSGVATLSISTLTEGVHTVSAVYLGDANFNGSSTGVLNQTVINNAPTIVSGPTSTPSPLQGVGIDTTFSVIATDINGDPITITWNFGDGTTATGATVTKAYLTTGPKTVTVTITDGRTPPVTASVTITIVTSMTGNAADADGDGFTDELEIALGTNPFSALSTPFGGAPAGSPIPFNITGGLKITLKFNRSSSDTVNLTGSLPLPGSVNTGQSTIAFAIGGLIASVDVDARGKGTATTSAGTFKVTLTQSKKRLGPIQNVTYRMMFKGEAKAKFVDEGLLEENTIKGVTVPVTILYNRTFFQSSRTLTYTAKVGRSGTTK